MQLQSEWLHERYGFAGWRAVRDAEPSVTGIGFRFRGDELPGWRLHRSRPVRPVGQPPAMLTVWVPAPSNGGLLAVDLWEATTAEAARGHLLRLLGEFQGPALERDPGTGDVAFRAGSAAALFARGNYTVMVRSVDREPVPVGPVAHRLDQHIVAVPAEAAGGPSLRAVPGQGGGERVALDFDVARRLEAGAWIRFFARSGRIAIEGDRAWYTPGPGGPDEVTVVATDGEGAVSRSAMDPRPGRGQNG